jgi:hypothetical protein
MVNLLTTQRLTTLAVVASLPIVLVAVLAIFTDLDFLIRFAPDDTFYYLKIANLLAAGGNYPSFDGITKTTGFHPLYTFLLSLAQRVFDFSPEGFFKAALAINLTAYIFTAVIVARIGKIMDAQIGAFCMLIVFLSCARFALFPLSGMEAAINVLLAAAFIYCYLIALRRVGSPPNILVLGLIGAALVSTRTDNIIFIVLAFFHLILLSSFAGPKPFRQAIYLLAGLFFVFTLLAAWILYCHAITGDWIQSSAVMKRIFRSMELKDATLIEQGFYSMEHFFEFVSGVLISAPAVKYSVVLLIPLAETLRRNILLAPWQGIFLLALTPFYMGFVFAVTLPGIHLWYQALPLIALVTSSGAIITEAIKTLSAAKWRGYLSVLLVLSVVEGVAVTSYTIMRSDRSARADTKLFARDKLGALPESAVIGSWNAGIFGYFSGKQVINLDGLVNAEIPKAYHENGLNWPYWVKRELTHLVDDARWFEGVPKCFADRCLVLVDSMPLTRGRIIQLYKIEKGN